MGIKVALVGIGNCASAFVQGLYYYSSSSEAEHRGLSRPAIAGLRPKHIEVVAAFDVDERKIERDLSEAIFAEPNNTMRIIDVPRTNVIVRKGPLLDGIGKHLENIVQTSILPEVNITQTLREANAEILVNLLPSGAVKASRWYAEQALDAGCAFINATPVSIANDKKFAARFARAGLPLVGDDLIDQVGSTTIHKTLLRFLSMQGVRITDTYQLDVGGGSESLDTLERTRNIKRDVKTRSVASALDYKANIVAGSTDFVGFLENRRDSYFWIKGDYFCGAPMEIDLRLSTFDAPNAGSALLDVIRAVKLAIDRGLKGTILPISAYTFKNPPKLIPLKDADELFTDFITADEQVRS